MDIEFRKHDLESLGRLIQAQAADGADPLRIAAGYFAVAGRRGVHFILYEDTQELARRIDAPLFNFDLN